MKRKIFIIVVPIIAVIACIFIFGIRSYKNSFDNFQEDGYVISQEKYYFSKENQYKINKSIGNVEFKTSENKEIKVEEASFLHYVDGSISTFKKAVVLNLDDINKDVYQYYNFFPGTTFNKGSNEYRIAYLDRSLDMKNFLIKISDDKYMVVSNKITVYIGDEVKTINDSYLEINYVDGNIIRLDNQEISLQNVSENLIISLGNKVSIDLIKKKILYEDVEKINLGEITINSNDNIDIISDEDNELNQSNSKGNSNNSGDGSGKSNTFGGNDSQSSSKLPNLSEISNGIVEVDSSVVEEIVEENAAIKDANFSVAEISVTANAVKAEIQISDEEETLSGNRTIKVIRNDTNEIVYYDQDSSGRTSIPIDIENLKPETNYTLVINSDYVKNNVTYNKDFVQKTFITTAIGIEIEKNYAKTDELSFDILKKSYSDVSQYKYYLKNEKDEVVSESTIDIRDKNTLTFDGLNPDTIYTLTLKDFVYSNIMISGGEEISGKYTTLKRRPIVGSSSFSVDKQNSKFVLFLNNIKDQDNGIVSYHAEIYDGDRLVTKKNSKTNSNIEVLVDNEIIERNTNYKVYVYLLFNDNEKEYEIPIGSETMNMNTTRKGPSVTFKETKITWESILGNILIKDEDNSIDISRNIYVSYQNLSVGTGVIIEKKYNLSRTAEEELVLPIDINNLRANDSYLFTIKAYVDYNDNNGYVLADIGQLIIQTGKPESMTVEFDDVPDAAGSFSVRARLKSLASNVDTNYEAQTMAEITFRLYNENYDEAQECVSWNGCWEKTVYDENDKDYESTLKTEYYDKDFYITPRLMDINEDEITYGLYTIKVFNAKDYTEFKNELPIENNSKTISANSSSSGIISRTSPAELTPILNGGTYDTLNDDTVIGYRVTPNVLPGDSVIQKIIYHVYSAVTNDEITSIEREPSNNQDIAQTIYFDDYDGFERGKSYYFTFEIKTDKNDSYEKSNNSDKVYPKKQEAEFNLYISKRVGNTITWKYSLTDIDKSIVGNAIYYGVGTNELGYKTATLSSTDGNTLKEFDCTDISSGRLNLFRVVQLNEEIENTKVTDAQVYIENVLEGFDSFSYEVTDGINVAVVGLNIGDSRALKIISADVKLTAEDGTSETLHDLAVVDKKIMIQYNDIRSLKEKGDIRLDIKLYYDNGKIGPESESTNSEYAFQLSDGTYYEILGKKKVKLDSFKFDSKEIGVASGSEKKTLNYILNKGYLKIDDKDLLVKATNITTGECDNNCTFKFDTITPSIELDNGRIEAILTAIRLDPKITSVDSAIEDKMMIKLTLCKSVDGTCDSSYEKQINIPLGDFKDYTINGLELGTDYLISMKWYESDKPSQMNRFYYPEVEDYEKNYLVHTLDSVGIEKVETKYISNNNSRKMSLSYTVNVTDGYDGIRYSVYDENNNPINLSIPNDEIDTIKQSSGKISKTIDIAYKLSAKTQYKIKIIPYRIDAEHAYEKVSLESREALFYFTIDEPKVTVIRKTQVTNNKFGFRILVTDSGSATFGKNEYSIYVKDSTRNDYESEYGEFIDKNTIDNTRVSYDDITCDSGVCSIFVVYESDENNTNNYVEKAYEKEFRLNEDVLIDYALPVASNDANNIVIAFAEYCNLNAINTLQYTIVTKDGEVVKTETVSPVVFTVENDESNYAYLALKENLTQGGYIITLTFNWQTADGTGTDYKSLSVEYIKTQG